MWNSIQVALGPTTHRARYRIENGQLVLEWRGGRHQERCGLLKPDFLAEHCLRQLVSQQRSVAA